MDMVLIGLILSLTFLAVFFPVLPAAARVYTRFHRREALTCPETGALTSVKISAARAARTTLFTGRARLRVSDCARWPERKGCPEGCLTGIA